MIVIGQELEVSSCEVYNDQQAKKTGGYFSWLLENQWAFDSYSYIAIFDDKVVASQELIDRLFLYAETLGVLIAHPSLKENSPYRELITRCHGSFLHRWTNWFDYVAPVFKSSFLRECTNSPRLNSLFAGNEFIWSGSCPSIPGDIAIIDAIQIEWTGVLASREENTSSSLTEQNNYLRARLISAQTGLRKSVDNICALTKDGSFLHLGEESFLRLIVRDIQNKSLSCHPIKDERGDWISTRSVYNAYVNQLYENIKAMQENAASDHLNNSLSIAAIQAGMLYETLSRI